MTKSDVTADSILAFWFPELAEPDPASHLALWTWRMRGGAHNAVVADYSDLTALAASGGLAHWAETSRGRLALIIVLDQFSRSVWAGTPRAYAQDPLALDLCLEGLRNGHFDSLENVWYKAMFKLPLEHCECADHLGNLDRAVAIGETLAEQAPAALRAIYLGGARQPHLHRTVIATFGRHPHRNAVLGRASTPEEEAYLTKGDFPHQTDLSKLGG